MSTLIYFLDDEQSFCQIFSEYIQSVGYEVLVFTDHEEAYSQLQIKLPDIICIDYRLKGITGDEFVKRVPNSVAKILITGELTFNNGHLFDAHLNKPFRLNELKELIDATIKNRLPDR